MKRRWDDDVVFKNQARGTEGKQNPEFVNVSLYRSCTKVIANEIIGSLAVRLSQTIYGMFNPSLGG
jgi:hypothetical protein